METALELHESKGRQQILEIYRRMTPAQKWTQAMNLWRAAWKLKEASVRARHPEWGDDQVREVVKKAFLYGVT